MRNVRAQRECKQESVSRRNGTGRDGEAFTIRRDGTLTFHVSRVLSWHFSVALSKARAAAPVAPTISRGGIKPNVNETLFLWSMVGGSESGSVFTS